MRYLAKVWTWSQDGYEHYGDAGLHPTERTALDAAKRYLGGEPEPNGDCHYEVIIERGELIHVDYELPGPDGEPSFVRECPELPWDHGYSNVDWRQDEDYDPPVDVICERGTGCREAKLK